MNSLAKVTDDTPDYLEYGDYRGWVELDGDGSYIADVSDHTEWITEHAAVKDPATNGEYDVTYTATR